MVVVTESRELVLLYSESFKHLAQHERGTVAVYGAFSGKLQHGDSSVDEAAYNGPLKEMLNLKDTKDMHKKCDVLVICDRFETGYDNSARMLWPVCESGPGSPGTVCHQA